ncbi:non-heme iron oxygenase ferredoxin subunit [Panacagrimonas sp.]|uniref:non-heme iron oxygenase ferredoxin subunit n=1 Tax=Panacagrimonas sp. TaxID=2480088 RepID=UPI003B51649D
MSIFHPLLRADEIFEDEIKNAILPDGTKVAIYNLNGAYYVTDDTCTHENASLSEEGMIDGSHVICGWHFCGFDIATGAATASPCSEPLKTYAIQVIDGVIHAGL